MSLIEQVETTTSARSSTAPNKAVRVCLGTAIRIVVLGVVFTWLLGFGTQPVAASHSVFKRALQEHYNFASVSCNTCHVPDEDRSVRNDLGSVFADRLKGQELSERFFAARRRGFEERREFEKLMQVEFLQVLRQIEDNRTDNGQTFGQRFRSGGFEGLRLR